MPPFPRNPVLSLIILHARSPDKGEPVRLEADPPALRRRAAVEPVISHMKAEHRMGRNYLAHATGDAINAVLAAVGYNFRRLLTWLAAFLLSALTLAIANQNLPQPDLSPPKP